MRSTNLYALAPPGQASNLRHPLRANKAAKWYRPYRSHSQARSGNHEAPFPDHPESKRNFRLPMRHVVWLDLLRQHVPRYLPVLGFGLRPDRHSPIPASTQLRTDSDMLPSENCQSHHPDFVTTRPGFDQAVLDIRHSMAPDRWLAGGLTIPELLPDARRNMNGKPTAHNLRCKPSRFPQSKAFVSGNAMPSSSDVSSRQYLEFEGQPAQFALRNLAGSYSRDFVL